MIDYLATESFVFIGRVGFIEDAVMFVRVERDTSEQVMCIETGIRIYNILTVPHQRIK